MQFNKVFEIPTRGEKPEFLIKCPFVFHSKANKVKEIQILKRIK